MSTGELKHYFISAGVRLLAWFVFCPIAHFTQELIKSVQR